MKNHFQRPVSELVLMTVSSQKGKKVIWRTLVVVEFKICSTDSQEEIRRARRHNYIFVCFFSILTSQSYWQVISHNVSLSLFFFFFYQIWRLWSSLYLSLHVFVTFPSKHFPLFSRSILLNKYFLSVQLFLSRERWDSWILSWNFLVLELDFLLVSWLVSFFSFILSLKILSG